MTLEQIQYLTLGAVALVVVAAFITIVLLPDTSRDTDEFNHE